MVAEMSKENNICSSKQIAKRSQLATVSRSTKQRNKERNDAHFANIEHLLRSPLHTIAPSYPSPFVRHSTRPMRQCRLTRQPALDSSSMAKLFGIRLNTTNAQFSAAFINELGNIKLRGVERALLQTIDEQAVRARQAFYGLLAMADQPLKRVQREYFHTEKEEQPSIPLKLVPESKWVYKTPHKQRLKKMNELHFDNASSWIPAFVQGRTIYSLERSHSILSSGEVTRINVGYLNPECILNTDDKEILQSEVEAWYERDSSQPGIEGLNWYEEHMQMLATCRPQKRGRGDSFKRNLSFKIQNDLPKHSLIVTNSKEDKENASPPCKVSRISYHISKHN